MAVFSKPNCYEKFFPYFVKPNPPIKTMTAGQHNTNHFIILIMVLLLSFFSK